MSGTEKMGRAKQNTCLRRSQAQFPEPVDMLPYTAKGTLQI